MKTGFILSIASLLPLVTVAILAIFGITLNTWVYIVLAVVCPLIAGAIWLTYKDVEKKIKNTGEEVGRRNKSG